MSSLRDDGLQRDPSDTGSAPGLTVAAVARRLGVAPATLRTWDHRYGLGPSERTPGTHRRYGELDVARLIVMRKLALDGTAPMDAARAALAMDLSTVNSEAIEEDLRRVLSGNADVTPAARPSSPAPSSPAPRPAVSADGVGGTAPPAGEVNDALSTGARVLRIATGTEAPLRTPDAVVDAVLARDAELCTELLRMDATSSPARWWETLVSPALRRLAHRTVLAGPGEAPELMLVDVAMNAISRYVETLRDRAAQQGRPMRHPSRSGNMVLVFLAPGDAHPLPAHALAAALAGHDVATRIVTGPANEHRVLEIITMVRPVATVMVTSLVHPELDLVHAISEAHPTVPQFVGLEHDSAAVDLPLVANVHRTRSFSGLLYEVLAIAERRGR